MLKHVKFFLIFFIIVLINSGHSKEPCKYLIYTEEIISAFVQEMNQQFGLIYIGYGGRLNGGVKKIEISFISYKTMNLDQARKLEVIATEKFLKIINNNKEIKTYLHQFPFTVNDAQISISVRSSKDTRPLDGSIAYVFTAKNKIFYRKAELVKRKTIPTISADGSPLPSYMTEAKEYVAEALIPLYEEPYEEALKIVKESCPNLGH